MAAPQPRAPPERVSETAIVTRARSPSTRALPSGSTDLPPERRAHTSSHPEHRLGGVLGPFGMAAPQPPAPGAGACQKLPL
eukprot:scaffold4399_cov115-Isochrysis_galbana.AAC.2